MTGASLTVNLNEGEEVVGISVIGTGVVGLSEDGRVDNSSSVGGGVGLTAVGRGLPSPKGGGVAWGG